VHEKLHSAEGEHQNAILCRSDRIVELHEIVGLYFPALVSPVHALVAVFGTMALAGRTRPITLILEGGSGSGKTTVISMALPKGMVGEYVYRSDKFTPKSFVTHAANRKKSELHRIDLLPQLRHRVLLTKELAPMFRGREHELQEIFSILISVLDGKGYVTNSGTQGQRGYAEDVRFNWLGATTPLEPRVHRLMSQLGTRLLFYEVPTVTPTSAELVEFLKRRDPDEAEHVCNSAVTSFLDDFFAEYPVCSVSMERIEFPEDKMKWLAQIAQFLVHARREVRFGKEGGTNWKPVGANSPESPFRLLQSLKELALGHALVCRRMHVNESDLRLVEEIGISSVPGHLRPIVRELRVKPKINSGQVEELLKVSRPTARNYLEELWLLGLATLTKGNRKSPHVITLAPDYKWLKSLP
jgi:hypothetical protein